MVGYLDAKYEISPSKLSLERLPQEILSLKGREFNLFQITPTGTLKRVERMEMVCFLLVQAQNSRLKLLWKLPLVCLFFVCFFIYLFLLLLLLVVVVVVVVVFVVIVVVIVFVVVVVVVVVVVIIVVDVVVVIVIVIVIVLL